MLGAGNFKFTVPGNDDTKINVRGVEIHGVSTFDLYLHVRLDFVAAEAVLLSPTSYPYYFATRHSSSSVSDQTAMSPWTLGSKIPKI